MMMLKKLQHRMVFREEWLTPGLERERICDEPEMFFAARGSGRASERKGHVKRLQSQSGSNWCNLNNKLLEHYSPTQGGK